MDSELDVLGHDAPQNRLQARENGAEVEQHRPQDLTSAEHQELAGQGDQLIARRRDLLRLPAAWIPRPSSSRRR